MRVLEGVSILIEPFMPQVSRLMREQLGAPALAAPGAPARACWPLEPPALPVGRALAKGQPIFPRLDPAREKEIRAAFTPKAPEPTKPEAKPKQSQATVEGTISFDDFSKLDLRVGLIKSASRPAGKDRLLELRVDLGSEERTIVAGLGKSYAPEELVGKSVVVLANLAPKSFGSKLVSHGMVLAGEHDGVLRVVSAEGLAPGSSVR